MTANTKEKDLCACPIPFLDIASRTWRVDDNVDILEDKKRTNMDGNTYPGSSAASGLGKEEESEVRSDSREVIVSKEKLPPPEELVSVLETEEDTGIVGGW